LSSTFLSCSPRQQESQQTVVNCFVSGFSIRNGRAETTALVFDTERMSVVGEGEIDLKTEKLNIALKPSPKESAGTGTAGKITQSLTDLAKPFRLAGTLANPSLAVDPTQAAVTATQIAESFGFLGKKGASAAPARNGGGYRSSALPLSKQPGRESNGPCYNTGEEGCHRNWLQAPRECQGSPGGLQEAFRQVRVSQGQSMIRLLE